MISHYIIPFLYLYHTRINTIKNLILYIGDYILLLLMIAIYFKVNLILLILGIILTIYNYECGYMYNDAITIKNEKNPTLRIDEDEIKKIQKDYNNYFFIRKLITILILIIIYIYYKINILYFVLSILGIDIVYILHNKFRTKFNIITYFLLLILRFLSPFFLCELEIKNIFKILIVIFLFRVLKRTIEFSCKDRFNIFSNKISKMILQRKFTYFYYMVLIFFTIFSNDCLIKFLMLYQIIFFIFKSLVKKFKR